MTTKKTAKKTSAAKKSGGGAAGEAPAMRIPEPEMKPISEINRAAYNPRVMPREKMAALKASIRKHGMVQNFVIQRDGDVLVGGHQRLDAIEEVCKEDGLPVPERVPCVVLDLTDAEAKQLNVALNNIEGEFDPYKLGELFASIKHGLTLEDIVATGFTPVEVDQAVALVLPVDEQIVELENEIGADGEGVGAFAKSITLTVEFETVEQRDQAKALLKDLIAKQGVKPGKLVMTALRAMANSEPARRKKKAA